MTNYFGSSGFFFQVGNGDGPLPSGNPGYVTAFYSAFSTRGLRHACQIQDLGLSAADRRCLTARCDHLAEGRFNSQHTARFQPFFTRNASTDIEAVTYYSPLINLVRFNNGSPLEAAALENGEAIPLEINGGALPLARFSNSLRSNDRWRSTRQREKWTSAELQV